MKNLWMAVLAVVIIQSCSPDSQNVAPTAKNSLGLIVPSGNSTSSNLILLKDGRTANPVSGIPDFKSMRAGSKLALSFVAASTHDGVVDINVTNYADAKDSVFTVGNSNSDTTSLAGLFKGTLNRGGYNSDTTSTQVEILFSGPYYKATITVAGVSSDIKGKFVVSNSTIDFSGWAFSSGADHLLLNYFVHQGYLFMWAVINGEYVSFTLNKNAVMPRLFEGKFSGGISYRIEGTDSLSSLISHPISISFDGSNKYTCTGVENNYPSAGSGTITIKNDGVNTWLGTIEFKDAATSSDSVLNGVFHYQFSDLENRNLGLFATRNGIAYSIYLHKD